jgi:hypothetical protein
MSTLQFDLDEVRRVVLHAKTAPAHALWYGEALGPRVLLVKDEGIYLMSNGQPRDMLDGRPDALGAQSFVAYAKGYDPRLVTDPGMLHEQCRAAVGGDDFSEPLELAGFEEAIADPKTVGIALRVTRRDISIIVQQQRT